MSFCPEGARQRLKRTARESRVHVEVNDQTASKALLASARSQELQQLRQFRKQLARAGFRPLVAGLFLPAGGALASSWGQSGLSGASASDNQ